MFDRSLWNALMLIGLALPIAGCNTSSGGLDSIAVTPNTDSLVVGGPTLQLTATGTFGNAKSPTTQVITTSVTWSSAIPGVATVSSAGVVTAVGPGTTTITATGQGYAGPVSGTAQVTVTGGSGVVEGITGLSIIPNTQSVALAGQTGQFIALGTTSSGLQQNLTTSVTWTSSNTSVATISATGLATAVGSGTTTITAIATNLDKTVVTATGTFTVTGVTSEPLISLAITPSTLTVATAGQTGQFIAIGTFAATSSTPGTRDLTTTVAWASSNPQVATITANGGLATATGPGTTVITAIATNPDKTVVTQTATFTVTGSGTSSTEPLASLAIVPASQASLTTGAGANVNFIAIGTTGSGATVNLTNQSATIGKVTVAAASWYSSNPAVASVNLTTGVATPITGGATAITAIATNPDGTVVTATAAYTVTVPAATEPLVSLVIVPNSQDSLSTGATANVNFVAIGTTGSGATVDMNLPYNVPGTSPQVTIPAATFGSSNPAVASFNGAEGVATPVSGGATAITAIVRNPDGTVVTASAAYTVTVAATKEPIVSLAILPASQTSLATGAVANVQFIAIGTTASGTTVNMNQPYSVPGTTPQATIPAATWSSSNPAVASFSGNPEGVATPKAGGATAITAIVTNPDGTVVTASAAYTVTVPAATEPYVSLAIVPVSQTATAVGQTAQFIAIGTTPSGTTVDLTNAPGVQWTSSSVQVAAPYIPAGQSTAVPGEFAAVANGAVVITAEVPNPGIGSKPADGTVVSANASFTVAISGSTEPLTSLSILPSSQSVASAGQSTQFLAIGTFSPTSTTPGTQNMASISTYTVNWYSSNPAVATVCAPPGPCAATQGAVTGTPVFVTGQSQGTTVITAVATNVKDGSVVTAAAAFAVSGPLAQQVTALAITPGSQSIALPAAGSTTPATVNFIAIGTNGSTGLQQDETCAVSWISSNVQVATISSTAGSPCAPIGPTGNIAAGVATAVGPGTATITAIYANTTSNGGVVTATATLTVAAVTNTEPYVSLTIVPASQTITAASQTAQFFAIGTTAAGTTVDLTSQAIWSSSSNAVAAPSAVIKGQFATPVNGPSGAVAITAEFNNSNVNGASDLTSETASAVLTVAIPATPEPLLSMAIVPGSGSVPAGQPTQFLALGTFSASAPTPGVQNMASASGYTVSWYSSNPAVATVCAAPGPCTTTQGAVTGTPVIVSGFTQGTTVITAIASGNPNGNLVTATAAFTVTGPSASAITSLSIFPASQSITMPEVGQPNPTVNMVVIGTNGAGLQTSVTPQVWTSSNPAVLPSANIVPGTNSTVATVVGPGTTTITASYTNVASASIPVSSVVTTTATLTVTGPAQEPLLSIAINPSSPSVAFPTQTDQLTAIGTYSAAPVTQNLTSTVAWKSSNLSVATVCTAGSAAPCTSATDGLVTAVGQGTTAITATTSNPDGSLVYATAPFTVTGGSAQQMTELTLVPSTLTLSATGQAGSLIALGTSGSTGLQQDVTASPQVVWASANPTIATVSSLPGAGAGQTQTCALNNATPPVTVCTPDPPGLVKGVSAGSTTITAEFFDQAATTTTPAVVVTATANVTVTTTPAAEPLLSITILPSSISTGNLYGNGQFLAYGAFSTDPTEMDITNGFFHAGFPGTGYPSSSCTTALAAADAATAAADAAANQPVNNLPNPQCGFVPVTWISDAPFIFPIDSSGAAGATGGLVTAEGNGTDIIYAQATNPDGTIVYSTTPATFNCPYKAPTYATTTTYVNGLPVVSYTSQVIDPGSCNDLTIAPELVSTVTVYGVGLNIGSQPPANWLVTAPSATGTPNVIHCGGTAEQATAQGSVCTAAYPNGTLLTLTAPHVDGVNFGGWSDNCAPVGAVTAAGPNSCTITVGSDATSNVSVVAIFN